MYHDEYAQANHFNLLLPRGSCCSAPLPENTASSVSIDLENSSNSYAKVVKQTSQTHPPFKPHLIKVAESKQLTWSRSNSFKYKKHCLRTLKQLRKGQLNLQKLPLPNKLLL